MTKPANVKALYFDVFGTVCDWYSRVVKEGAAITEKTGVEVNWGEFAIRWRIEGYVGALIKIAGGEMDLIPTEQIHRDKLDLMLPEYGLEGKLTEEEITDFNLVWNRIEPWADSVEGITKLKENYIVMPFSNGDLRCMTEVAKNGGLPWDAIISADFFKKVKPDPTIYKDALDLMFFKPEEVMMVACHAQDLAGAIRAGMRTAYVNRPLEYGPGRDPEAKPDPFDYDVDSFIELANALEADRDA